jgi:hypothetical protein
MISSFQAGTELSGILKQAGRPFQVEMDEVEKARNEVGISVDKCRQRDSKSPTIAAQNL